MKNKSPEKEKTPFRQSLKEYGRGIIGGLLFSLPIIYTMEVWWTGFIASPEKLLAYVVATFLLLLGYNKFAGMRKDASFWEICRDSVEEIGLAFIATFLFLCLIDRINLGMSLYEIAGKTIVESMIMAIGISVGTAQLGQKNDGNSGMEDDKKHTQTKDRDDYFQISILSICGAVLVASSVAPTDEILVIGIESSPVQLLLMVFVSLLLSAVTMYFSDFRGALNGARDIEKIGLHVMIGYMVALLVSVALLWFFGRLHYSVHAIIALTIVLAIPATIGASAGRLLITNPKS